MSSPSPSLEQYPQQIRRLSVIIPVYNGAKTIRPLVDRLFECLDGHYSLEVVLINDGSPEDDSRDVCREIARSRGPSVRFIHLSKNFGEHNAVMAGLQYCTGDAAVFVDDDFQNPPEEVVKLVKKLEEGYDVVFSYYDQKKHHWFRNLGSAFHGWVARIMLQKPKGLYLSSFKAVNRFVITEITKYKGPYPYIDGLILRVSRNYGTQLVAHDPRMENQSGYTLVKLVRLWLNMFTNFSILPLRAASILGFLFAAAGFLFALYVIAERIMNPQLPVGWSSTMCILLVVSGVQLFALGMIGEYLGRLFLKDNGTPQYAVRETVNCPLTPEESQREVSGT